MKRGQKKKWHTWGLRTAQVHALDALLREALAVEGRQCLAESVDRARVLPAALLHVGAEAVRNHAARLALGVQLLQLRERLLCLCDVHLCMPAASAAAQRSFSTQFFNANAAFPTVRSYQPLQQLSILV